MAATAGGVAMGHVAATGINRVRIHWGIHGVYSTNKFWWDI